MIDPLQIEAANLIAPLINSATKVRQGGLAVTTTTAGIDVGSTLSKGKDGHFITIIADADVYVAFNNSNSGTLDETQVSGTGMCWLIPSKVPFACRLVADYTFLRAKTAAGTATLRFYISSMGSAQHARDI